MYWDVLKNSTNESESLSSSSSLLDQLNRLSFGYEKETSDSSIQRQQRRMMMTRRRFPDAKEAMKVNRFVPIAVCDPSRVSGCAPLLGERSASFNRSTALTDLPCVTEGLCPFIKFKCSKGHEWKASPGSPVCMHCPLCDSKQISGKKRDRQTSRSKIKEELKLYIESREGQLVSRLTDVASHNTYVSVQCQRLHEWECSVGNLLLLNTWCPVCHADGMRLSQAELQKTAQHSLVIHRLRYS